MQLIKDLFKKKTIGGICLVVLILFLLVAVFADVIAPTPLGTAHRTISASCWMPSTFMARRPQAT